MARGQPQEIDRDATQSDDFVSTSSRAELRWLEAALDRQFEIKSKTIGHDVGDRTEVKILNRVISVTQQGFRYEPDLRHAEVVVSELGLENAKSVSSPWTDACDSSSLLDAEHFKKYQSISKRVNFLAQDRMDLQFAAKECARKMSKPTVGDWGRLKRIGRYLRGHLRCIMKTNSSRFQSISHHTLMPIGLWTQKQGRVPVVVSLRSESTTSKVGEKRKRLSHFLQRRVNCTGS